MAEEQDKKEEQYEFTPEGEALGYISSDQARVLAMRIARENPGDYGRRFTGVSMAFEVVEDEDTEDHYVITLSFRPQGQFIGAPGQEQFFIEKEGNVAHRQVMALPRRRRHYPVIPVAIGLAVAGVVAAIIVLALEEFGPEDDGEPGFSSVPTATPFPAIPTQPPASTQAQAVVSSGEATPTPTPERPAPTLTPTPTPERPTPTLTPAPTSVRPTPTPTPTLRPPTPLAPATTAGPVLIAPCNTPQDAASNLELIRTLQDEGRRHPRMQELMQDIMPAFRAGDVSTACRLMDTLLELLGAQPSTSQSPTPPTPTTPAPSIAVAPAAARVVYRDSRHPTSWVGL